MGQPGHTAHPWSEGGIPFHPHGRLGGWGYSVPDAAAGGGQQSLSCCQSGFEEDPGGWVLLDMQTICPATKTAGVSRLIRSWLRAGHRVKGLSSPRA